MTPAELNIIFNTFNNLKALIIGDAMVDAYLWGSVNRQSPEAPVPVVSVSKRENRLGGAANVALNIEALGATPVLCAAVGNDEKGNWFMERIRERGLSAAGIVQSDSRITTSKTRVISDEKHVVRVDEEVENELNGEETTRLLAKIEEHIDDADVIIFEDYNKGTVTAEVIEKVVALAGKKNIPTAIDPKARNFMAYHGVSLFKPNLKELKDGLQANINPADAKQLIRVAGQLRSKLKCGIALVTLSEHGILVSADGVQELIPAHKRNVVDVSGAGDTVISVAALCLAQGLSPVRIAVLANLAGGLVCEKAGVVPVDKSQLLMEAEKLSEKIVPGNP